MTTAELGDAPSADGAPARPARSRRARVIDGLRWLAIVVVVAFAGYKLAKEWDGFWRTLGSIAWQSSLLSQLVLITSIAVSTYGWQVMVDDLGKPIGYARGAQINLVGALGKYVPGSVWQYLLQMELGRKAGLARARIFVGSLVQLGIGIVAALVLSLLAMPAVFANSPRAVWLLVLLPIGLVALHPRVLTWGTSLVLRILRRPPLDHRLRWVTIGKVFGAGIATFTLQGAHLWLLANSIGAPGLGGMALCVGAMAIAMTAGNFAFIMPGGAGVRETVMVAVLTASALTSTQAFALALASRVMFIVADIVTAGGAALTARLQARRHAPPPN